MKLPIACLAVLVVILIIEPIQASQFIVNLSANSLGYDSQSNYIYASVAFSSPTNANSLMPVDPGNGQLGTAIPIGTRLGQIAVSSDNAYVYTVAQDGHGVQRYNVASNSLDQSFTMPGSGQFFQSVRQLYSIPGQPNALLIERGLNNFSPPAVATGVWDNGVERPQTVGTQLGSGGPDILAVDPGGVKAYGYQNSVSSFGTWAMAIDANGIHQTQLVTNGPLSGGIGHIAAANNRLFDDHGNVYDANNNFAIVGSFQTSGNFAIDPVLNKLFSVSQVGSSETIRVYDLATLQQTGSIAVTGIGTPSTGNLIRVGSDGLAFTTSNNQVVILHSALVPEPSTWAMALAACLIVSIRQLARSRGNSAKAPSCS